MSNSKLLVEKLKNKKHTLATAESLTGGLLSSAIVDISGSSKVFNGGVVTYTLNIKEKVLNVPLSLTELTDGVDYVTAQLMAKNVCELMDSDYGLSTTGIAERYDERPEQAYISLYIRETAESIYKHITFDEFKPTDNVREIVREEIVNQAIFLLLENLKGS